MGLIGNKITPNYGSKVKDRKTFEMLQLGALRFNPRKLCHLHIFSYCKSHVGRQGHYHILRPCIAKYLHYCRNDPFANVGETIGLQCKCYFTCLSSVTKKDLGCRFWTDLHSVFSQVSINKIKGYLSCAILPPFSVKLSIVSICSVNPEHADYNWVSWNVIFSDKN